MKRGEALQASVDVVGHQLVALVVVLENPGAVSGAVAAPAQELRSKEAGGFVGVVISAHALFIQKTNLDPATALIDDGVHVESSLAESLENGLGGRGAGHWVGCV
jgi:hypothetical protein